MRHHNRTVPYVGERWELGTKALPDCTSSKSETSGALLTGFTQKTAQILSLGKRGLLLVCRRPGRAFLIVRMAHWVAVLAVLMKFLSLPRALEKISPAVNRDGKSRIDGADELASAVSALLGTGIFMFRPICWKRAAILHRYLALRGIENQIKFGLRKDKNGTINGHAWVEANGSPILEDTPPNYTVTYVFPSRKKFEVDLNLLTER